ncbi:MAG TPA: hypothetical protein PKC28_02800 [Bdellovibrionales bacterium]|nr:hypothetical protein [Bdellovibrionales bacterium]
MLRHFPLILAGFVTSSFAFAQAPQQAPAQPQAKPKKSIAIDSGRATSISYGSPSWNTDSTKIDSAYLVMRDKTSGKILQIQLEETEPDSSNFRGQFALSLRAGETIAPEIFIPPQELRNSDKDNKKLYDMIQSGKLPRKPVIWTKNEKGQPVLDVYDTREQAEAALKAYQEAEKIARDSRRRGRGKQPLASAAAIAAAKQAEHQAELNRLALEAAKREAERVRLEQIEKQKTEERERQLKALNEKQRAARRAQAVELAKEAMGLYKQGDYPGAEAKFRESLELDPDSRDSHFNYGVTLYRNEKYNDALVTLKMAQVDSKTDLERRYYMGLIHYRLQEFEPALRQFKDVAASGHPELGPSAEFYRGVIYYSQEEYAASKKSFETVIDTSKDPRLDEQAEAYLDRLANAMAFQRLRDKKFTFTGTVGGMYDSNILLSPDNTADQGGQTEVADFRLLTIADLEYRAILNEKHELTGKVNASLTNSLKDEAAIADPWIYTVSAPYSYKSMLWGKGYKFTAKPSYEILYMDPTNAGKKTNIFSAAALGLDNTLIMRPNWFSVYTLEYRMDDTKTADSVGPADADATKISLKTTQMFFVDKARKEAVVVNFGYVLNDAKGGDRAYNRIEAGAIYVRPAWSNVTWNAGLMIYRLDYADATVKRDDLNTMLLAGLSKPVKDWLVWGVMGNYTKNDSSVSINEYSKYTIMTTATFTQVF